MIDTTEPLKEIITKFMSQNLKEIDVHKDLIDLLKMVREYFHEELTSFVDAIILEVKPNKTEKEIDFIKVIYKILVYKIDLKITNYK